jgi:hypothetical protein
MTWVEWNAARQLLYEEQLGVHLRAKDREAAVKEQRKADEYAASVRRLKAQQG